MSYISGFKGIINYLLQGDREVWTLALHATLVSKFLILERYRRDNVCVIRHSFHNFSLVISCPTSVIQHAHWITPPEGSNTVVITPNNLLISLLDVISSCYTAYKSTPHSFCLSYIIFSPFQLSHLLSSAIQLRSYSYSHDHITRNCRFVTNSLTSYVIHLDYLSRVIFIALF